MVDKKGRGPGKKAPLVLTSIRLPKYAMDYFKVVHPEGRQVKMREVLVSYVDEQLKQGESSEGSNRE